MVTFQAVIMIKGFYEKGFTLVEAMIVVAIVGVIASLAVPAWGQLMAI